MSSSSTTSVPRRDTPGVRPVRVPDALRGAAIAGAVAAVANLLVFLAARAADVELLIPASPGGTPDTPLGAAPVVFATLVPMLLGGLVYAAISRRSSRPPRVWAAVVGVVTLLSFGPIAALGAGAGTTLTLGAMHVIAATVAGLVLPRTVHRDV